MALGDIHRDLQRFGRLYTHTESPLLFSGALADGAGDFDGENSGHDFYGVSPICLVVEQPGRNSKVV